MNILIIGNGGREHALAWKIAQSPHVAKIYVAPGNAGTAQESKTSNIDIDPLDFPKLMEFAKQYQITYTIVGPEAPLAAGIVDAFNLVGLHCFGPTQKGAKLEASKEYAKNFMEHNDIPTAKYATFTAIEAAKAYVKSEGTPIVIKADGLAGGKGVIIAHTEKEAFMAIEAMLGTHQFGSAGNRIVIEEFLTGEEASFIVLTDGRHVIPMVTSQDHKARDEGDKGPNTGGMGAYSPAPIISSHLQEEILATIIEPALRGLRANNIHYQGFLYAGLMITPAGQPKVLEFNCRLGDPEAEVILMRMKSDIMDLIINVQKQQLHLASLQWDPRPALGIIMANKGYPNQVERGHEILFTHALPEDTKIFHAGTKVENNQIRTHGGRVLCVTALGHNIHEAQLKALKAISTIQCPTLFYRKDIGHRAITTATALR